jgi:hypothetical protein
MQPLTETQMQAFIQAYVPEQAEAMLRQLRDRLREFGQTPLLLWMLCEVFQQTPNNQLPSNLAGVFQVFTNTYEISSVRKHEVALLKGDVKPLSDRRLWKKALKALASVMMQGETPVDFRVVIHRDEAERELSKIFPNEQFPVRDILDDLLKYHLLQNRNTDQIEFRHQLIQEYYAAEYLLRRLPEQSDEQLKRDYLNYLKWTEPIALMLALENKEAQALRVVKLAMDDVDLMVGARLAGDVKHDLQTQTVNIIDNLVIPLKFKIQFFGLTRSPAALPFLSQSLNNALNHQDFQVKRNARRVISNINGEAAQTNHPDIFVNQSPDNYVDTMINQLTSRYNFTELIHALSAASPDEAWQFSSALMKVSQPEQMDFLSKFMLESDSNNIFKYVPSLISFIQNRCKFYNYEIWRYAIQNEKLEIKNGEQETAVGQTTTIFKIETLNAPNAALNLGGIIHGDQTGTQSH